MRTPSPSWCWTRHTLAAAALALGAASALASTDVASLVYASGDAMAPEAEAHLRTLTTAPGGALTRDEVRQQLADARHEGRLAQPGEMAEPATVLLARHQANERQTQQILAAQDAERQRLAALEAERQRVAALEAEAETRRQAELQTRQAAADTSSATLGGAAPALAVDPVATATTTQDRPLPAEAPSDAPAPQPFDRPLLAPLEVPIARPSEVPAEVLIDKD